MRMATMLDMVTGRARRRRARQAEIQKFAQQMPGFTFVNLPDGGYTVKRGA